MRISSSLFFQTGLNSINAQQADLMHIYQQVASGQRMVTPADDPLAAAQAVNISQSQSLNARFDANRSVLNRNLGLEENTLNSVTLLLQDVKTRLVEAGNGTMSDVDRATLGNVLKEARTNLLGLANATDGNGQYLFSGADGEVEPFQPNNATGKIEYQGDDFQRKIQADQTRQIFSGDVGTDVFSRAAPGASGYVTRATLQGTSTVSVGKPTITAPNNPNVGSKFTVTFVSPTEYRVEIRPEGGPTVTQPALTDPPLSFVPSEGAQYIKLPASSGTGEAGVQFMISGTPVAGDVVEIESVSSSGTNLNIFDTLDEVIAALSNGTGDATDTAKFQNALAGALQRIDVNYNNVLTVRSSVGARMNEVDALNANGAQRHLSYTNQLSKLEDLDYYAATAQLQLRTSALEAAAMAFKKIQATSLFNMTQ